jgi:hypothetical protein
MFLMLLWFFPEGHQIRIDQTPSKYDYFRYRCGTLMGPNRRGALMF